MIGITLRLLFSPNRRLRAASNIGRLLFEEEIDQGGRHRPVFHTRGRRRSVQRRQYLRSEAPVQRVRPFGHLVQVEARHVEKQAHEVAAQLGRGLVPLRRYQGLRRYRRRIVGGAKEREPVEGGGRQPAERRATIEIPIGFDESGSSSEQQQLRIQVRQLRDIQREQLQPELGDVADVLQLRGDRGILDNERGIPEALFQEGDVHERGEDLQPGRGEHAIFEQQTPQDQARDEAAQLRSVLHEQHRVHETFY